MEAMLRFDSYFGDLDREVDRFIDRLQRQKRPLVQFSGEGWAPLMDVFETPEMVVAIVELAGVDESQVQVTVQDRMLTVSGERRHRTEHQPHSYHIIEINQGRFERTVPLPAPVHAEQTKAAIRNGMLEVCMPKLQAQQISISVVQAELRRGS
jgi:HSP20 family protein